MKKILYLTFFAALFCSFTSCKKFLTVTPKTQLPQDDQFSTEGGFEDALTGIYIQMKSSSSYGQALTQTTMEDIISSWTVSSNSTGERLGLFQFSDEGVQNRFTSIWSQQYSTIAGINAILEQIEKHRDVFVTDGEYEIIKSECLALRAYLHFDILRIFGPIPSDPSSGPSLPYAKKLTKTPIERISPDAFKTNILNDLTDAEDLVKDVDPIRQYSLRDLRIIGTGTNYGLKSEFQAFRYLRMNYYAIKALQARIALWFGEKQEAFNLAKGIIDAKNEDGSAKFRLGTAGDLSDDVGDYVMTNEHIFGLYDFQMSDHYSDNYGSGNRKKGDSESQIKSTLFGSTGTDIRESSLWEAFTLSNGTGVYTIKKYKMEANSEQLTEDYKQIPMIRLSEMYLIAAEAGGMTNGLPYLQDFRDARNIGLMPDPQNELELEAEIMKEYRKEFYAEGQAFYTYKRLNASTANIIFAPASAQVNYVVPIPPRETISE